MKNTVQTYRNDSPAKEAVTAARLVRLDRTLDPFRQLSLVVRPDGKASSRFDLVKLFSQEIKVRSIAGRARGGKRA